MEISQKITLENAEKYKWGTNCDGWHLLKNDALSVIREKMPPGTTEHSHLHTNAQQLFYILSGVAMFEVAGKVTAVAATESFFIPPNTNHRIYNNSHDDLHFLVISQPRSHGDRIELILAG